MNYKYLIGIGIAGIVAYIGWKQYSAYNNSINDNTDLNESADAINPYASVIGKVSGSVTDNPQYANQSVERNSETDRLAANQALVKSLFGELTDPALDLQAERAMKFTLSLAAGSYSGIQDKSAIGTTIIDENRVQSSALDATLQNSLARVRYGWV